MSELKGQILGIILVIVIFGLISFELKEVFKNSVDDIAQRIEDTTSLI